MSDFPVSRERLPEDAREPGLGAQVTVMLSLVLLLLLGMAGLAVDAAGAWRMSQSQSDTLTSARELVMNAQEAVKYGLKQGGTTLAAPETVAALVKEYLEDSGAAEHMDLARLTVYELPQSKSGPADRYIGVLIEFTGTYETSFAQAIGVGEIPVESRTCFIVHPYATSKVWRPSTAADAIQVTYTPTGTNGAVSSKVTSTSADWASLDAELKGVLEDASGA